MAILRQFVVNDEDPFKFLKEQFDEIARETKQECGVDWQLWIDHHNSWIDVVSSVIDMIPYSQQSNSMLVFRLLEMQKTLLWLQISALSGAYHQLIRDLRFLLDSFVQAYYLDINFSDKSILEKLKIVEDQEMELFGRKLIGKIGLDQVDEVANLYGILSKYQHSSYEEMKSALEEGNVDQRVLFIFDKELFYKCKSFTNKVIDIVFYLVLKAFPVAVEELKKKGDIIQWFKELDSKLTVQLLTQLLR